VIGYSQLQWVWHFCYLSPVVTVRFSSTAWRGWATGTSSVGHMAQHKTSLCLASYISWQRDTAHMLSTSRAAIDRRLLAAGPTAANPPKRCALAGDGAYGQLAGRSTVSWSLLCILCEHQYPKISNHYNCSLCGNIYDVKFCTRLFWGFGVLTRDV